MLGKVYSVPKMSLRCVLSFGILLIAPIVIGKRTEGYRFKLDIGNPNIYCPSPNYTCSNGKLHYLCKEKSEINEHCMHYRPLQPSKEAKKSFIEGTNGIRNKIAVDLGISNMNILYWSEELSAMATIYLRECTIDYDPCMIIGERQVKVSQNFAFIKGQVSDQAPQRIVRHWYMEFGTDVNNWRDYKRKHLTGKMGNITNMIYPLSEFMGCSSAHMYHGYLFVCYYHPPYVRSEFPQNFANGYSCTNCTETRSICSRTFAGLCGVDLELNGGSPFCSNLFLLIVSTLIWFCKAVMS